MKSPFSILLLSFLVFSCFHTFANDRYPVSDIDPALLTDADAVIREDNQTWEIHRNKQARLSRKLVITIVNNSGLRFVDLKLNHDSFVKIKDVGGAIYDAQGKKVRDLERNEFQDVHSGDGFSIYSDARELQTDLYYHQYPFTVEFTYTVEESFLYPNKFWMPVNSTGISLQNASFSCIVPSDFKFRYKQNNFINNAPEINPASGNKLMYIWKLNDLPAWQLEPFMTIAAEVLPLVLIGPEEFEYGGYPGSMKTWDDFGKWIISLNLNRQNLPDKTQEDVKEIVARYPGDTLSIIRGIYEYVQQNTRYVSIQLGIGGFQPFDATYVVQNQYGDCKALANFTYALLAEAGIRSHYSWIHSGPRFFEVDPEFPFNSFNHVILCVPLAQDTIWLETTANIVPMGYIGVSNSDRWSLVITETGGELVRTPPVVSEDNLVTTNIHLSANQEYSVEGTSIKKLEGLSMSDLIGVSLFGKEKLTDYYRQLVTVNNFELLDINFTEEKKANPFIEEKIDFSIQNYFRKVGNRLLFQPLLMAYTPQVSSNKKERKTDFRLDFYKSYKDTIEWQLPGNFQPASLPDNYISDTPFGYYSIEYSHNQTKNTLTLMRHFYGKRGVFSPAQWPDFLEFMQEVKRNDNMQMMLVSRE